ncbi:hypothetical protein Hokovirus_1_289 [Hokovirus HKV1]|uniref:Uncharacterized protein n=1 Tax=Hokovirus HKV1 TaxID=1977638 RepID=A0A1V0SFB6_9VIRU|nr:hypothetical protein Hokovirus_1_289 [Hokovirus HKV1]
MDLPTCCKYCRYPFANHNDNNIFVYELLYNYFQKNIDKVLNNYYLVKNKKISDMIIKPSFYNNKYTDIEQNVKIFKRLCEIMNDMNYYTDFNIRFKLDFIDNDFLRRADNITCVLLKYFNYDIIKKKNTHNSIFKTIFYKKFNVQNIKLLKNYKNFIRLMVSRIENANISSSVYYNNEEDFIYELTQVEQIMNTLNFDHEIFKTYYDRIYNEIKFHKNDDSIYESLCDLFLLNLFYENKIMLKNMLLHTLNTIFEHYRVTNIHYILEFYITKLKVNIDSEIFNAIVKIYANCQYVSNHKNIFNKASANHLNYRYIDKHEYVKQIYDILVKYSNIKNYTELNNIVYDIYPEPVLNNKDKKIEQIIKEKIIKHKEEKTKKMIKNNKKSELSFAWIFETKFENKKGSKKQRKKRSNKITKNKIK